MYTVYFLFILAYTSYIQSSGTKNYGTYEIILTEARTCKGPKRKECANSTVNINGKSIISYDIIVTESLGSIKGKVIGIFDGKEIISIRLLKPCEHIYFKPLLKMLLQVTDDCFIVKGRYKFVLNMSDIVKNYHGEAFLFGNWTYKALFYSDNCNFSCGIYSISIYPRKKM